MKLFYYDTEMKSCDFMDDMENSHVKRIVLQVLQVHAEQVCTCAQDLFLLVHLTEMSPESNLSPGRELIITCINVGIVQFTTIY